MSLTPPLPILDHSQILREIMLVYQSSLLGDEDEDDVSAGFVQVLDIMVDPLITVCIESTDAKKKVRPTWDGVVFLLNCLCYLLVCPFSVCSTDPTDSVIECFGVI